jgi:hypothetical protein
MSAPHARLRLENTSKCVTEKRLDSTQSLSRGDFQSTKCLTVARGQSIASGKYHEGSSFQFDFKAHKPQTGSALQ